MGTAIGLIASDILICLTFDVKEEEDWRVDLAAVRRASFGSL